MIFFSEAEIVKLDRIANFVCPDQLVYLKVCLAIWIIKFRQEEDYFVYDM